MNAGIIGAIILISLLACFFFTMSGIKDCKENNALGLIWLFLGLNILGLLIGFAILYNNKQKKNGN